MLLQKTANAADTLLNLPMSMNICTADLNAPAIEPGAEDKMAWTPQHTALDSMVDDIGFCGM